MKRIIIPLLAGVVAVLLAVSLIAYFDPFRLFFDSIFVEQQEPALGNVGYTCSWNGLESTPYAEAAAQPLKMTERYFECFYSALGDKVAKCTNTLRELYGRACEDLIYDLAALYSCTARLDGSAIDLSFKGVNVRLSLKNIIPFGGDGFIITVLQSAEVNFHSLRGISGGEGVYTHTFIYERKSGVWHLESHECIEGMWGYSFRVMNTLCGSGSPDYSLLYEKYSDFEAILPSKIRDISTLITAKGYGTLYEAEYPYDREAAVSYAFQWSNPLEKFRNTEQWHDYEGDDSVNFASQCLYAGLKHMDVEGGLKWKWFDERINLESSDSGCSNSWFKGESFWIYCTENDREGICCHTNAAGGQLEKGDVIQLMLNEKVFSEVVVTDVVTNMNKDILEFLVTGHDSEYVNYPLSLIPCDGVRFIKVIGWND